MSPRFIEPYKIVERIDPVAYRLVLPLELEKIHNVFHLSILGQYRSDPSHVIPYNKFELQPNMTYSEKPVRILALKVKELRNKRVPLVKVLWHHHGSEKATWETEESMKSQYPNLFLSNKFQGQNFLKGKSCKNLIFSGIGNIGSRPPNLMNNLVNFNIYYDEGILIGRTTSIL